MASERSVQARSERPTEVSVGAALLGLPIVAGLLQTAMNALGVGNLHEPLPRVLGLLLAAWLLLQLYLVWLAYQGRNWARIVAAIVAVLALVALPGEIGVLVASGFHPLVMFTTATTALGPLGLIALFLPEANDWFWVKRAER